MRTIKSTRREEIELIGNLSLFRNACFHLHDPTANLTIKSYIENIISGRGYYKTASKTIQVIHRLPVINRICQIFSDQNLQFFASCKVGHIRYTTYNYSKSKVADDSAVLFKVIDEYIFGLINSIFTDDSNEVLLELWPLSYSKNLHIRTKTKNIDMPSIQEGTLENNNNFYYVSVQDIIEKCVYWRKKSKQVIFFRYPNLEESS